MTINLNYWLYKKNINKRQLSIKAKVGYTTILQIASGEREPNQKTLSKLANALEITIPDLYISA